MKTNNKPWSKKSNKERVERVYEHYDKKRKKVLKAPLYAKCYLDGMSDGITMVVDALEVVVRDWEDK